MAGRGQAQLMRPGALIERVAVVFELAAAKRIAGRVVISAVEIEPRGGIVERRPAQVEVGDEGEEVEALIRRPKGDGAVGLVAPERSREIRWRIGVQIVALVDQ